MDKPTAWRDLAAQFTELRRLEKDALYACWTPSAWDEDGHQWFVGGAANRRVLKLFNWAAERGAILLGQPQSEASVLFWLDLLRQGSPHYSCGPTITSRTATGGIDEIETGRIDSLCLASAEYCYKLETAAIEKESQKWTVVSGAAHHSRIIPTPFVFGRNAAEPLSPRRGKTRDRSLQDKTPETIAVQLDRLRDECRLTTQDLAEKIDVNVRTVQRHLRGDSTPYPRHLRAYERVFSKLLHRQVVIKKMSPRCR